MKNREYKKLLAVALMVAMVGSMTGTATMQLRAADTETETSSSSIESSIESKISSLLDEKESESKEAKATKSETVYAKIDESGSIKAVTVSDQLKNITDETKVEDKSNLTDIENVKGDEEYKESNGSLTWNVDGKDIVYQGTGDAGTIPVGIKITYKLDGKEVKASDLEGKSGHLVIRYDYQNLSKQKTGSFVPFLMATGIVVDGDVFTNVTTTNAKLASDGDRDLVIGYGLPGISEELDLTDLDIPSYFEMEADVKDYETPQSVTFGTNDVFNKIDVDGFDSIDDLKAAMTELNDATNELVDGTGQLKDGLNQLQEKSGTLVSGVDQLATGGDQLASGTKQLSDGANTLANGTGQLTDGANTLASGTGQLADGTNTLVSGTGQLADGTNTLAGGASQVAEGAASAASQTSTKLLDGANQLDAGLGLMQGQLGQLGTLSTSVTALNAGTQQLAAGASTLHAGINQAAAGAMALSAGINQAADGAKQISAGISGVETSVNQLSDAAADVAASLNTDVAFSTTADISDITVNVDNSASITALKEARDAILAADSTDATGAAAKIDSVISGLSAQTGVGSVQGYSVSGTVNLVAGTAQGQEAAAVAGGLSALLADDKLPALSAGAAAINAGLNTSTQTGVPSAKDGAAQLAATLSSTDPTSQTIGGGITALDAGLNKSTESQLCLNDGMNALNTAINGTGNGDGLVDTLPAGVNALKAGSTQLKAGVGTLAEGLNTLSAGASQVSTGASTLNSKMSEANSGAQTLASKMTEASSGAQTLASKMSEANTGANTLATNMATANTGAQTLKDGINTLKSSTPQLVDGIKQLDDGAIKLNSGMIEYKETGIDKLVDVFDGDIDQLLDRLNEMLDSSKEYKNYSGISDKMDGSVKFVFVADSEAE